MVKIQYFLIFICKANFSRAYGRDTNLSHGIFRKVSFIEANLNESNLRETALSQADLTSVKANNTDFSQAILTGIIIEDWEINNQTKFDNVIADHIYLSHQQKINIDNQISLNTANFLNVIMANNKNILENLEKDVQKIIDIFQILKAVIKQK